MARSSSTPAAKAAPEEPSVGSRVHVQQDDAAAAEEDEEVIGTVPSVAHGWFSVSLPGQAQVRAIVGTGRDDRAQRRAWDWIALSVWF